MWVFRQSKFPAALPQGPPGRRQFLPAIEFLVMPSCGMTGNIPQWLGDLTKLESLDLSGNSLSGKLPIFAPSTPIKTIGLAYNNLEGNLDALLTATLLTRLNLDSNYINVRQIRHGILDQVPREVLGAIPPRTRRVTWPSLSSCLVDAGA